MDWSVGYLPVFRKVLLASEVSVDDGLFEASWDRGILYGAELNDVVWCDEAGHGT